MLKKIAAVLSAALIASGFLVGAGGTPAFAAGSIYQYVVMYQNGWDGIDDADDLPVVTKLAANLEVDSPYVDTYNSPQDHSLVQLLIDRYTVVSGVGHHQYLEVGWCVNCHANSEQSTRLFTSAWKDDVWLGFGSDSGSGFVSYCPVTPCTANDSVILADGGTPLASKAFVIEHMTVSGVGTGWWVAYDGKYFGYWPDSIWTSASGGAFTSGYSVQVFGETVTNEWNTGGSCSDMFDGTAANLVSDTVGGFAGSTTVNGSSTGVSMSITNTKPSAYKGKLITGSVRSMRLTGNGDC